MFGLSGTSQQYGRPPSRSTRDRAEMHVYAYSSVNVVGDFTPSGLLETRYIDANLAARGLQLPIPPYLAMGTYKLPILVLALACTVSYATPSHHVCLFLSSAHLTH